MDRNRTTGIFVRVLLPFSLGILVFYGRNCINHLLNASVLLFTVLLVLNIGYVKIRGYRWKGLIGFMFFSFIFLYGGISVMNHDQSLSKTYHANSANEFYKISIQDEPRIKNKVLRFKASVLSGYQSNSSEGKPLSGSLMVSILLDSINRNTFRYGDALLVPNKSVVVKSMANGSGFDYKSWLASQNIYHQLFVRENEIAKLDSNCGNQVVDFAIRLREKQVIYYRKIIKDDEAFAIASTLILGHRANLDIQTLNIYSKTGTIHALSVSGMHVGLVYLVLNWLLQVLDRRTILKIAKVLIIVSAIWFYALLTGFSPSVLRSVIMLSVFIIAKLLNKNTNNYNILAFTAFCLLIYNPFLIWDIGFQLSFLAVIGLIWLQPMIEKWFDMENRWLNKIWAMIAMSLSAQIITFPFSIYYFHQFPVYFLLGNLFIILPIAILMYLGIAILILKIEYLGPLFEWTILFTNAGLKKIAALPLSSLSVIEINKIELSILCTAIVLFIIACSDFNKKMLFGSLICCLALLSSVSYRKIQMKFNPQTLNTNYFK